MRVQEPRDSSGATMGEVIDWLVGELDHDELGMYWLADHASSFKLSEADHDDFLRRIIVALLNAGAQPVVGHSQGWIGWKPVYYGDTPEKIAEAVVAEWRREEGPSFVGYTRVWFTTPDNIPRRLAFVPT